MGKPILMLYRVIAKTGRSTKLLGKNKQEVKHGYELIQFGTARQLKTKRCIAHG
jgi:hypothetical protein